MNLGALKSSNFRTYVAGSIFGLIGMWMQRVTIGWLAWDMTGSSSFVGAIALVMFAPAIVLSPLFGVLADRMNVKRSMIAVQVVNFLVILGFFVFVAVDAMTPTIMMTLSVITGISMAANHPMRMALTPRLVHREYVSSVINIVAINFNIARMIGPAIAGLLLAVIGVAATLFVQAILFLPMILALSMVALRPRRERNSKKESFLSELKAGVVYAWQSPVVRSAMLLAGVLSIVARGALEILPPLADGVFGRGPDGLGVLLSVTGVGAVIGGFLKAMLPPQKSGKLSGFTVATILAGLLSVSALGLAQSWEMALVVVAGMSFVTTITAISVQTAIQLDLEDDMRGRVMSLWAVVAAGGASLGAGLMGVAGDLVGIQATLIYAGVIATVCAGLITAGFARQK